MPMAFYSKIYLLLIPLLTGTLICKAQKTYTGNDSITIQQKINNVSKLIDENQSKEALKLATEALQISEEKKFLHGKAWASIKINDILIGEGDYANTAAPSTGIIQFGGQLKNDEVTGIGYLQTAQYKMYTNKVAEAEQLFEKSIALLGNKNEYAALAWNERGFIAGLTGDLQKQTDYYLKALRIYEKLNNESGMAMVYSNLSVLYNDIQQTEKGIEYAKKSIEMRERLKDTRGLSYAYCNISQMYLSIDLKEAEKYSLLCTRAAEELNNDGRRIHAINTAGLVRERMGLKNEVLKSSLQIVEILEKKSNPSIDLARQYIATGIIMSEGRMDSITALQYLDKGLNMSILVNDKSSIRDAYQMKTVFFKIRNDFYNAYENIKKYHSYKDSIITGNTQTNIAELQTKYETEKKDNEITRLYSEQKINQLQIDKLSTEQRIKQLAIEKQNAVIAGNKLLAKQKEDEIALLSKERELLDLQIKQQTAALEKQVLIGKNQQQQLQLAEKEKALNEAAVKRQKQSKRIIIGAALASLLLGGILFNRYQLKKKIAEQQALLAVRDNIAKDLHDEVGSALSSIKILSEVSYKNIEKDKEKSAALLQQIVAQSEKSQQGISDIVWSVKPDNDKLENITVRMREYISQTLEPKNVEIIFQADDDVLQKKLGMQQRKDVLLIFKEAVNNIAKYSQCTKATVSIESNSNHLFFHFIDNGIGFNPDKITSSSGLKNMKARAASLNGDMQIISSPCNGTKLTLTIPTS
jgi:two-component system, NarL family, sensor histidine kinase UhpB